MYLDLDIVRTSQIFLLGLLLLIHTLMLLPFPYHLKKRVLDSVNKPEIKYYFRPGWWAILLINILLLLDAGYQTRFFSVRLDIVEDNEMAGLQDHAGKHEFETNLLVNERNLFLSTMNVFLLIAIRRFAVMLLQLDANDVEISDLKRKLDSEGSKAEREWRHEEFKRREEGSNTTSPAEADPSKVVQG